MADEAAAPAEHRPLRLEALAEIERLVAEYCHGADKRDRERFMAVWHPEAVWDVGAYVFSGTDQIQEAIERQWSAQPRMFHWTSNLSVDVDLAAESATGECDVIAFTQTLDSGWFRSAGTYRDVYRRYQGRWLIFERRATVHFTMGAADLRDHAEPHPTGPAGAESASDSGDRAGRAVTR